MAIANVQNVAPVTASGSPLSAAISISPTAGNALIVFVGQSSSGTRTYTVSDNIDGSTGWNRAVYYNPGFSVGIWYKANVPSGVTTVTVTHGSGTVGFRAGAAEFSGMGTTITVQSSDTKDESPTTSGSHTCSTSGLTYGSECLSVCSGIITATATECNPGSGYTENSSGFAQNQSLKQFQVFASGCTSETGAWSNTGTARIGQSCMALLSGNAGSSAVGKGLIDSNLLAPRRLTA